MRAAVALLVPQAVAQAVQAAVPSAVQAAVVAQSRPRYCIEATPDERRAVVEVLNRNLAQSAAAAMEALLAEEAKPTAAPPRARRDAAYGGYMTYDHSRRR